MRRLAGITIATFTSLALAGAIGSTPFDVGGSEQQNADLVIVKTLPDTFDAELPTAWIFRVDAITPSCGNAIFPETGGAVDSLVVDVDAGGGASDDVGVLSQAVTGEPCVFRVIEFAVDGWEPVSPSNGIVEVTVEFEDRLQVPFSNQPVPPPETTTTTPVVTTTEPEATTTTVQDTTTTTEAAPTTAAPTTLPATTTGTIAPELPATGSSNTLAALLAGLFVIGGVGAVLASRRAT